MGQLAGGEVAIDYFKKGIEIMSDSIAQAGASVEPSCSIEDLSNAYCSLAEVYLTDSW